MPNAQYVTVIVHLGNSRFYERRKNVKQLRGRTHQANHNIIPWNYELDIGLVASLFITHLDLSNEQVG